MSGQSGRAPSYEVKLLVREPLGLTWGNALGAAGRFDSLDDLAKVLPDVAQAVRTGALHELPRQYINTGGDTTRVTITYSLDTTPEELPRDFPDMAREAVETIPDGSEVRIVVEVVP